MFKNNNEVLVCILVLIYICFIEHSSGYFHLYETSKDRKHGTIRDHDCFYASIPEITEKYLLLRAYCLRPTDDEMNDLEKKSVINESQIVGKRLTFSELDQLNITSERLYEWSAPIEHYQQYRINSSRSNEIFYNCSSPLWFGSFCQYTLNSSESFSEIVMERFLSRLSLKLRSDEIQKEILRITNGTCYIHLKCHRGPLPMCLDWREICDGKCDCLDNCNDEKNCFQLEMNECDKDHFRCTNGMCIPQYLVFDNFHFPDCMDASDVHAASFRQQKYHSTYIHVVERQVVEKEDGRLYLIETQSLVQQNAFDINDACFGYPTFECDILTCNWYDRFVCGDGQCSKAHPPTKLSMCLNGRDQLHTRSLLAYDQTLQFSENCWLAIICALNFEAFFAIDCTTPRLPQNECLSSFFFLSSSIVSHGISYLFERNRTGPFKPSYLCYDTKKCPVYLTESISITDSSCIKIRKDQIFDTSRNIRLSFEQVCPMANLLMSNTSNCSHPSLYHYRNSLRCISKHRLQDRNIDCYNSDDELFDYSLH